MQGFLCCSINTEQSPLLETVTEMHRDSQRSGSIQAGADTCKWQTVNGAVTINHRQTQEIGREVEDSNFKAAGDHVSLKRLGSSVALQQYGCLNKT